MTGTVRLLGLDFADLTADEAADAIAARPVGSAFGYVVTPNADHLVRISRDPTLPPIYRDAWMRLLDLHVVAGLGAMRGLRVPRVATGSDLTKSLLEWHIHRDERIVIVGLRPEWLDALVTKCDLPPPFHYDPAMGFDQDRAAFAKTVAFVLDHPARFVFFAVGSPRQERLAAAVAATGRGTGTGLCIGASLAFLAGAEARAPASGCKPPRAGMGIPVDARPQTVGAAGMPDGQARVCCRC